MSTSPVLNRRHALGLPAGSVRAAHVLGIVGIFCAILLVPARGDIAIPPYLTYLMFLMLGHFFAAHGVTIAGALDPAPSPLFLKGGLVRVLIILGLVGTIGWGLYSDPNDLQARYERSLKALEVQPYVPLLILGGYLAGVIVRALVGRNPSSVLQDLEAWISILALVGILAAGILHIVIGPSLEAPIPMPLTEGALGTVIAFYFGERS